jgi:hypothetical protein
LHPSSRISPVSPAAPASVVRAAVLWMWVCCSQGDSQRTFSGRLPRDAGAIGRSSERGKGRFPEPGLGSASAGGRAAAGVGRVGVLAGEWVSVRHRRAAPGGQMPAAADGLGLGSASTWGHRGRPGPGRAVALVPSFVPGDKFPGARPASSRCDGCIWSRSGHSRLSSGAAGPERVVSGTSFWCRLAGFWCRVAGRRESAPGARARSRPRRGPERTKIAVTLITFTGADGLR